jgi:hypothetical protein
MVIGGVITAADVTAFQADAQMQPRVAGQQAVSATLDALGQLGDKDVVQVCAVGHRAASFRSR